MKIMDLRKLDLNLLRVLHVLMQEKNTRKAAERLHTSQPAVSRSLARLREELNDPLFVRNKQGLKLTARAEELSAVLPMLFSNLQRALEGETFDPKTLGGKFRIALNGFVMELYGSKIYSGLIKHCPNLNIELFSFDTSTKDKLIDDNLEIGITFEDLPSSKELYQTELMKCKFALVTQKGLFPPNTTMTAEEFANYPLAILIYPEINIEYIKMQKLIEKPLNIALRSQQVTPIFEALLTSPMLFVAPELIYKKLDPEKYQLIKFNDTKIPAESRFSMFYNSKYWNSPKYIWLEKTIKEIILS